MEKGFCFGVLIGMIGGMLVATNIPKVQRFIKEKQDTLTENIKKSSNTQKKTTD